MKSEIINVQQGTAEWHQHRAGSYNASEAPAMLGLSSYVTRSELLRRKALGVEPEIDEATQRRFDAGHAYEHQARAWAEEILGDDLFPVVLAADVTHNGHNMRLSASLDGQTMDGDITFEHKTLNNDLASILDAGSIPDEYKPQMEQGLLLSGASKCLFMASNGNRETMRFAWYEPDLFVRAKLLAGWAQFSADLAEYQHTEPSPNPIAQVVAGLPALFVQVEGRVVASNLPEFRLAANAFLARLPDPSALQSDQDFADAQEAVKTCKETAERLKTVKAQAQSQAASIDELFRAIDEITATIDRRRIDLDNRVSAEKEARKARLVRDAQLSIQSHIDKLHERIGGKWIPSPPASLFADAIRGLKSLDSMRDKISAALANSKIEASETADRIEANRKRLIVDDQDWMFLFPDFAGCCNKAPEDFANLLMHRTHEHKQREERKLEAERERIRQEEAQRITREAAHADLQAKAQAAIYQRGKPTEATHAAPSATATPQAPVASTPPDNGRRLNLSEIKAILAPISINVDGLATLGIHPVGQEKSAKLYRESDVQAICMAMIRHLEQLMH